MEQTQSDETANRGQNSDELGREARQFAKWLSEAEAQLEFVKGELTDAMRERDELHAFLADAAAFARWAIGSGQSSQFIASTLLHDIGGLERRDECFSPRVSGYAAKERA